MKFIENLKNLGKIKPFYTDNLVFRLHYKFTLVVLVVFAILLTSKQLFGDPITCDVENRDRKNIIDLFCWISGTFILIKGQELDKNGYEDLRYLGNEVTIPAKKSVALLYYQWICLIFCIQALIFYIPRLLWKTWEGGQLDQLLQDLCGPLVSEKWTALYKQKLIGFLLYAPTRHNIQAWRFAFCEAMNLINLIGQIFFMDWYLGGGFSLYGPEVLMNGMPFISDRLFPKRTKCTYTRFGVSGSPERHDALCALPLNVLNEKFFLFLWCWYALLFVFTLIALVYRVLFLYSTSFRTYLLLAQSRDISNKKLKYIAEFLSHGQFFTLYTMGKNMNPLIYSELLLTIYENINIRCETSVISA